MYMAVPIMVELEYLKLIFAITYIIILSVTLSVHFIDCLTVAFLPIHLNSLPQAPPLYNILCLHE